MFNIIKKLYKFKSINIWKEKKLQKTFKGIFVIIFI